MRRKLAIGGLFSALLVAGALTASAIAGKGPLGVQQTVSTSTTGSTTTGSSSASSTTGSTSTGSTTTGTTATTTTSTTTTTTTTTPKPAKITICAHVWPKRGAVRHVTKRINRSAWPSYKKRGASLGACNTAAAKRFHRKPAHIKRFHHRGR